MKQVFFLLFAASFWGSSPSTHAQQGPDRLRADAMEATRQLANRIALDDARSVQVRRLTYDRLVQENQITALYNDDPAMRQNKLRVVEQDYTEKLRNVLTEAQFQRYLALMANKNTSGAAPAAQPAKPVAVPTKAAGH